MSLYIPHNRNALIDYEHGDGFRTLALPKIHINDSLIISSRLLIDLCYADCKNVITIHRLRIDGAKKYKDIKTVIIDDRVPRKGSLAFNELKKLCKGKLILFIGKPYDLQSMALSMELISVTKKCELRVIKFNKFTYLRGW